MTAFFRRANTLLQAFVLLLAVVLLALHWAHLSADFPNYSRWMDWSKYTDEGWYGDAAIRHFQRGGWYVNGDFNPAAALPVWPFLEACLFHFTGVSLVAVRALTVAVFAGIMLASWLLLRRWTKSATARWHFAAPVAVLLLAASPFLFVFTRLAILEPLLVLLTLLAMLAASSASAVAPCVHWQEVRPVVTRNLGCILMLGVLLPLMILTKTTALFLVPAVAWLLLARMRYHLCSFFVVGLPAAVLAGLLWSSYFFLLIRPHYLLDYRYLFSANAYTGITLENFASVLVDTVKDGMWIGRILFPVAMLTIGFALAHGYGLRRHPLIVSLLLWAGGYSAFLAYHANLQPRYYLVVAVPLTLLVPLVAEQLLISRCKRAATVRTTGVLLATVLAVLVLTDARQTLHFVRHPEYTLLHAALQVDQYIETDRHRDPTHNPLVLSISGSDLSLMTGLPSICDDFGTLELADRVKRYMPGWYLAWNQIDDDKMDAMTPLFHIERVAEFPAMDDPDRNVLVLYRLEPSIVTKPVPRRRKPTPRPLLTKVGQQPSTSQLEH